MTHVLNSFFRPWPLVLVALLMALCAVPAPAKTPSAQTVSVSGALAPGGQQSLSARCPKKTHVSGGGFAVTPPFSQNGTPARVDDTGTQTSTLTSIFGGRKLWTAAGSAFNTPAAPGTFKAIARCEKNGLGNLVAFESGSTTIAPGTSSTAGVTCPANTHVLSGGFSGGPTPNLADPAGYRLLVVESKRTSRRRWEFVAVNPAGAPSAGTLSVEVLCESNSDKAPVQATVSGPITDNGRTSIAATCSGKKHVISGGFSISPLVGPAASVDQTSPVGKKTWQVALYEAAGFNLPAGSTLTTYAYCKKNS